MDFRRISKENRGKFSISNDNYMIMISVRERRGEIAEWVG